MNKTWQRTVFCSICILLYGPSILIAQVFFQKANTKPIIQVKLNDSRVLIELIPSLPILSRYNFAKSQFANGDKRKAVTMFMKLANEDPNGPLADDCTLMVMKYYLESGNLRKAYATYNKLGTLYPNRNSFFTGKEEILKSLYANPIEKNFTEVVDRYYESYTKNDSGLRDYSSQAEANAKKHIESEGFSFDKERTEKLKDSLIQSVLSSETFDILMKVSGANDVVIKPMLDKHIRSNLTLSDPYVSTMLYKKVKAERHLSYKYSHEIICDIAIEGHCLVHLKEIFQMKIISNRKKVKDGKEKHEKED